MTHFVFPAPAIPALPIAGSDLLFPVNRIYCVGRNYADHAIEMGGTGKEPPFFFMKPGNAVLPVRQGDTGKMPYPPKTGDLHHEIELVVAIGRPGSKIPVDEAESYIWGYAVGLDMTRRDLQAEAKKQGRPWCTAKGFDYSAPVGELMPRAATGDISHAGIRLSVNGSERQHSKIGKMIWNVPEIISALSELYTLQAGDLIFTGTPEGVAAVKRGDVLEGAIDLLGSLTVEII